LARHLAACGPTSTKVEAMPTPMVDPFAGRERADLGTDDARHSAACADFVVRIFGDGGPIARVSACFLPAMGYIRRHRKPFKAVPDLWWGRRGLCVLGIRRRSGYGALARY
jgi:hypothetical protein